MRIYLLLTLLLTGTAWSKSETSCHQVEGIYRNSTARMENLKLISFVDIFSFSNAKNLSVTINGESLRFARTSIDVSKNTKMNFVMLGKSMSRTAVVQMDRTPNSAINSKAFYGNIIINNPIYEWNEYDDSTFFPETLTYNFYCTF